METESWEQYKAGGIKTNGKEQSVKMRPVPFHLQTIILLEAYLFLFLNAGESKA